VSNQGAAPSLATAGKELISVRQFAIRGERKEGEGRSKTHGVPCKIRVAGAWHSIASAALLGSVF
jgi:hypothetical protein